MKRFKRTSFALMITTLLFSLHLLRQTSVAQGQSDSGVRVSSSFQALPPQPEWTAELRRVRFELEHNIPDQRMIQRPNTLFVASPNAVMHKDSQQLRDMLQRERYYLEHE